MNAGLNINELLTMKVLQLKQLNEGSGNGDLVDALLEAHPEQAEAITRNICAHIPIQLYKDVETMSSLLDMTKREIVTVALRWFVNAAHETMQCYDVSPFEFEQGGK